MEEEREKEEENKEKKMMMKWEQEHTHMRTNRTSTKTNQMKPNHIKLCLDTLYKESTTNRSKLKRKLLNLFTKHKQTSKLCTMHLTSLCSNDAITYSQNVNKRANCAPCTYITLFKWRHHLFTEHKQTSKLCTMHLHHFVQMTLFVVAERDSRPITNSWERNLHWHFNAQLALHSIVTDNARAWPLLWCVIVWKYTDGKYSLCIYPFVHFYPLSYSEL